MSDNHDRGPVSTRPLDEPASGKLTDARRRALMRRWRTVIGFGGLVLAASFFFPAVDGRNAPRAL